MTSLEPLVISVLIGGLFLAGLAKGITGFALPPVAMGLLASVTSVETALALVTLPLLVTNFWQAWEGRRIAEAFQRLWPLIITMGIGIFAGAKLLVVVSHEPLFVLLGVVAIAYVLLDLVRLPMTIPKGQEPYWHGLAGLLGGVVGGMTSAHGTLIAAYLHNLRMPKETFIAVSGVVWAVGSLYLLAALSSVDVFHLGLGGWSALAVIPALMGMALGRVMRKRLDQEIFHRLVLGALFLIGLNLLRRGFFG